jgi:integrase
LGEATFGNFVEDVFLPMKGESGEWRENTGNILDHAVMKKLIPANPARNPGYRLKAKSRKAVSGRYLSMEECQRLLSVVSGADHLAFRIFIQLGLRSEELFARRRNDVVEDTLRIDEAIVEGASATVKTETSEATVYSPPDLQTEFRCWLEGLSADPRAWLFPSPKELPWGAQNYLNPILKPAAIRAGVGLLKKRTRKGEGVESTDANFQVLRRTWGRRTSERRQRTQGHPRTTPAFGGHPKPANEGQLKTGQ